MMWHLIVNLGPTDLYTPDITSSDARLRGPQAATMACKAAFHRASLASSLTRFLPSFHAFPLAAHHVRPPPWLHGSYHATMQAR